MAKLNYNLRELDVDKLFQENTIEDIIKLERVIENEIEKKRVELRMMVGDRYKDILTASDAIISMKSISENIVDSIETITKRTEELVENANTVECLPPVVKPEKIEERTIAIQVRLTILMNEQIWLSIDEEKHSKAAQFYLLAQHIHTGLRLLKRDMIEKLPLLKRIKGTLEYLRSQILKNVDKKLKTVYLTSEESCNNLTALMLLQIESSSYVLNFFMEVRKSALKSLVEKSQESVRIQVSSMVQCLISTILLLHDCFICHETSNKGLIWVKLEEIVDDNSATTLSKVPLPNTPLVDYIPDIIKHFKPKRGTNNNLSTSDIHEEIHSWLEYTAAAVTEGLKNSLELVTSIKGLHIIRQEALKIDVPENWEKICTEINLPTSFNIWFNFFQNTMTHRAEVLIHKKLSVILTNIEEEISKKVDTAVKSSHSEKDLRWYLWLENINDISRTENKHLGLSMKTKGYSPTIVLLCEKFDADYLEFLQDISYYLFGKEFKADTPLMSYRINESRPDKKPVDREKLEKRLKEQCVLSSKKLAAFLVNSVQSELDQPVKVLKSIIYARFLQALTVLCSNFYKCCVCSGNSDGWDKICNNFKENSIKFWQNWVDNSIVETSELTKKLLLNVGITEMFSILPKWDLIEIQEQTEEKVFKSQIRVPSQPSLVLHEILKMLSNNLNSILPHTLPKQIHLQYIEKNTLEILVHYNNLLENNLNQNQALQFLFDVKFVTTFCIPKENIQLVQKSQAICDKFRSKIDPFDLDVFYSYIQNNVKQSVLQHQIILGCLLPSTSQLVNLGVLERNKEQEKDPSVLALSIPSTLSWFPLLPVTTPVQKTAPSPSQHKEHKVLVQKPIKTKARKPDAAGSLRSGAASLFGAMTTDWFS